MYHWIKIEKHWSTPPMCDQYRSTFHYLWFIKNVNSELMVNIGANIFGPHSIMSQFFDPLILFCDPTPITVTWNFEISPNRWWNLVIPPVGSRSSLPIQYRHSLKHMNIVPVSWEWLPNKVIYKWLVIGADCHNKFCCWLLYGDIEITMAYHWKSVVGQESFCAGRVFGVRVSKLDQELVLQTR